jgi:hypothetical protein
MRDVIFRTYRDRSFINLDTINNQVGALQGSSGNSHTVYNRMRLGDLNGLSLLEIFENNLNSGETIHFDQYEWKWVFWPNPRLGGCAPDCDKPKFVLDMMQRGSGGFLDTWEKQGVDDTRPNGVNCAAYAIARWMRYITVTSDASTSDFNKPLTVQLAFQIQEEMGWGELVGVAQLQKFVEEYPDYRIMLLEDDSYGIGKPFIGLEYQYTDEVSSHRKRKDKTIYLYYAYGRVGHYAAIKEYVAFTKKLKHLGTTHSYCRVCCIPYHKNYNHVCGKTDVIKPVNFNQEISCSKCKTRFRRFDDSGNKLPHVCPYFQCSNCNTSIKKGFELKHRCPLFILDDDNGVDFSKESCLHGEGAENEKKKDETVSLWAYDIESRMVEAQRGPVGMRRSVKEHVANLLVAKNVYSGEQMIWRGDDCLFDCIRYMLKYNHGNNIMVAHNGARYDSQLIYEACTKFENRGFEVDPCTRGVKILALSISKKGGKSALRFHDSMLHLQGSLASLASSFCANETGDSISKGYFPHGFNTKENWDFNYIGPVPNKEFYCMPTSCKTMAELDRFNAWYEEEKVKYNDPMHPSGGTWNFKEQLELYCINDVRILAIIMVKYAEAMMHTFPENPWFSLTAPSYVHKEILKKITMGYEIYDLLKDKTRKEEKLVKFKELVKENWTHLYENEYFFARKALRGGRTEARCVYRKLTQEEIDDGKMIRYVDIVSEYPYQQIVHKFPVGSPQVHVYHADFDPCYRCQRVVWTAGWVDDMERTGNLPGKCYCLDKYDKRLKVNKWFSKNINAVDHFKMLLENGAEGIVHATVYCPLDMIHPLLVEKSFNGKSVFQCGRVTGYWPTNTFKVALEHGYVVEQVFRFDQYEMRPSLWQEHLIPLFIEKQRNSWKYRGHPAEEEKFEELVEMYRHIGDDTGDFDLNEDFVNALEKSFRTQEWGNNPAAKQTAKTAMNSAWGKHAENPDKESRTSFTFEEDYIKYVEIMDQVRSGRLHLKDVSLMNRELIVKTTDNYVGAKDFGKTYLPAAVFCTAYGQLQLWREMHKIEQGAAYNRVLMCDTDSIVYIADTNVARGLYNVPEGKRLGQWEVEEISEEATFGGPRPDSDSNIVEFYSTAPKTYGVKTEKGYTLIKNKGMSIKANHRYEINFDKCRDFAKNLIVDGKLNVDRNDGNIKVSQWSFRMDELGIRTEEFNKWWRFDHDGIKGELGKDYFVYPYNYDNIPKLD